MVGMGARSLSAGIGKSLPGAVSWQELYLRESAVFLTTAEAVIPLSGSWQTASHCLGLNWIPSRWRRPWRVRGWMSQPLATCRYIVTPNLDHVVRLQSDAEFRRAYAAASLVIADGWPVVAAARWLGRPVPERVPGSELVPRLMHSAEPSGCSVFLLGAKPGVGRGQRRRYAEVGPVCRSWARTVRRSASNTTRRSCSRSRIGLPLRNRICWLSDSERRSKRSGSGGPIYDCVARWRLPPVPPSIFWPVSNDVRRDGVSESVWSGCIVCGAIQNGLPGVTSTMHSSFPRFSGTSGSQCGALFDEFEGERPDPAWR